MAKEKKEQTKTQTVKASNATEPMVLGKRNYILLIISVVVVILGFMLMTGTNGDVVDTKSRQLTIAPIVVMIGFALGIYSTLAKSPEDKQAEE